MVEKLASILDYEAYTKMTSPMRTFEYINGHAQDGFSKEDNENDFNLIKLKQRGMANLKYFRGIEMTILGHKVASPINMAPIGYQGLVQYQGECATAEAARDLNIIFGHTGIATKSITEVGEASKGGMKIY